MNRNTLFDHSKDPGTKDMFTKEFVKELDLPDSLTENGRIRTKQRLAGNIFKDFMGMILDDCMYNNVQFHSPTHPRLKIYIREKPKKEFKRIFGSGKKNLYKETNLIDSDFKIYEYIATCTSFLRRPIRVSHKRYTKIQKLVNNGMRYWVK